jgi:hypothetical protein
MVVMAVDNTTESVVARLNQEIRAVTTGDDRFFFRQGTQAALQAVRNPYAVTSSSA